VDHYEDFVYPLLKERGYDGLFQKKISSEHKDGVALLWKKQKYIIRIQKEETRERIRIESFHNFVCVSILDFD
jgi:hypothetical protein